MLAKINPKPLSGTVPAISSKSMAHRIIIAAALANGVTRVACDTTCADTGNLQLKQMHLDFINSGIV